MSTLHRAVRRKAPPIVVRVRGTRRRAAKAVGAHLRRDPGAEDLSSLILYGQAA